MVRICLEEGDYEQVVGIALDSRRLDVLEAALKAAQSGAGLLRYTQKEVLEHCTSLGFQQSVLELLVKIAESQTEVDYMFVCDCLVSTGNVPKCCDVLAAALQRPELLPVALQIAFNIYEVGPEFAQRVGAHFKMTVCDSGACKAVSADCGDKLMAVLSGRVPSVLSVRFLAKANSADLLILERSRETLSMHNSQHHQAIYYANGLMHSGSTNDEFLRKNMNWLSYASNWAKFGAAASLGMIHRGNVAAGWTVLAPYLPKPGSTGSPYAEGGALFALGLIHAKASAAASEERPVLPYLREQLAGTTEESAQHGACLGIGAVAMASHDTLLLDDLRGILYGDNAVAGEAAALSIGLVMAGSGDTALIQELLQYARETQHEKIVRGIASAAALIAYGQRDAVLGLVDELANDKDAILRFSAMWMLALAFAGTGDNGAVRRLLHAAVSESDDDVRRTAVTGLGFLLFKRPTELPQLLELLAASYNPHVRYGVAMALGVAFAGTGDQTAIDLVKPLCKDLTEFVRQGAYVSLGFILQQVSDAASNEAGPTRRLLASVAANKYEDANARFGAILAQGLIDAGGRNAALSLASPAAQQHNSLFGLCGTMLFCQFWHWYPAVAFLSLAMEPTGMLGIDASLQPPVAPFCSAAPPDLFAYPEPLKTAQTVQPKRLTTAVLSTTAKAAARAKKSGKADAMDLDVPTPAPSPTNEPAANPDLSIPETIVEAEEPPTHSTQPNFSRITKLQRRHIVFGEDLRWTPVMNPWPASIVTVLLDKEPAKPVEYIKEDEETEQDKDKKDEKPTEPADPVVKDSNGDVQMA
jgi:26S proteasome regulatory subunit N2